MNLLDVNLLIALAWGDHEHHQAAHAWFLANSGDGFATCHSTQSSFLRLSLNPNVVGTQLTCNEAIAALQSLTSHSAHSFWEDGAVETNSSIWSTVRGHLQVTDTNLFLIARRNDGKLVTFDAPLKNRLPQDQHRWVEVING